LKRRGLKAAFFAATLVAAAADSPGLAWAHDFKLGDLRIDHPYATPSRPGQTTAAVYLRALRNTGKEADELVGARTPMAESVELHRMHMEGGVMRMQVVDAITLPPRSELRHSQSDGHHLMLLGLKTPLKDGDRFPLTLRFRRAGEREVIVWVQTPRERAASAHSHRSTGHD
jgi:copper(I)-binding protein